MGGCETQLRAGEKTTVDRKISARVDCDRRDRPFHCDSGRRGLPRINVRLLSVLVLDESYSEVPLQPDRRRPLGKRVIGKICPRCGNPGSIVYQTKERIVFECPNGHQFEMKRRKNRNTGKSLA